MTRLLASIPEYPFVPKSTSSLRPGQFWSIPLENGRFACGRVIQLKVSNGKPDSRVFLAGLMDWYGDDAPTAESIAGRSVVIQGAAHVKAIRENDGKILGLRPLEVDGLEPGLFLDQSGGRECLVQRGFDVLGLASEEQKSALPVFSTWGYGVIKIVAETRYGKISSPVSDLRESK